MSQFPSDPGTDHNRRRAVTYDELIAMFVAFLTLGSVLFWGLTRSGMNLFGNAGPFNLEGASSLIEDLDSRSALDTSADIAGDGDGLGLGGAEAIRTTGDRDRRGDRNSSRDQTADATRPSQPVTSQPATVPSGSVPIPAPSLPKQEAQPAEAPGAAEDPAENPAAEQPAAIAPAVQVPLEASREALRFQDVPDGYWAKPYIDALSERLVIDGISEGTFAPEQPVTRAQLASAIAQAFPLDEEDAAIAFSDIQADYWATEAIDKAVKRGFMNGYPDESFQPTLPVPRAQVLTALVTGLDAGLPDNAQAIVDRYGDATEIPKWAIGKMAAATQANIVVNYPNLDTLNPNQPATRAEVAAMIYQTLAAQGRIDNIDGEYVVTP